jgi:hypothetical protein
MPKIFSLIILAFTFELSAQPVVNITGTVTDINSKTLSGASVKLIDLGLSTVTDSVGHFALSLAEVNTDVMKLRFIPPFISGDYLNFTVLKDNSRIRIDAFDCKGRLVNSVLDKKLSAGAYRIALCRTKSPAQLYFLRFSIGTICTYFKMSYVHDHAGNSTASVSAGTDFKNLFLAKKTAAVDTLEVSLTGFGTEKKPMDSYVGNYYIILKKGSAGRISFDSVSYKGVWSRMTITLEDSDITASIANVKVTSTKDTIGINIALNAVAGIPGRFTGSVGFSIVNSSSGFIYVADSNVVTVLYNDAAPEGVRVATAKFYLGLKKAFGIYGRSTTPASTVMAGALPKFFNWTNTCWVDSAINFAGTGNTIKLTGTGGWAGFGWAQVDNAGSLAGIDMYQFAACSLHVRLKGNANGISLLVGNNSGTYVPAGNYGYVGDEQWHEVIIPLSAWGALSLVAWFMGASFTPYTVGQYIIVDDLYWTLPQF